MYKRNNKTKSKKGGSPQKNKNTTRKNKIKKQNKMACSPLVEGKQVSSDTCYTPDILVKIKEEYNKGHENDPIKHDKPLEIWKVLKERLFHCEKEDCWLKEIKDKELRDNIDKYIFAPDYPEEWNENPNEWLSNYDILDVIQQYKIKYPPFEFIGPSAIDFDSKLKELDGQCVENQLCHFSLDKIIQKKKNFIGIIFNLDKYHESGSHWVSMCIDIKHKIIFYFDSGGDTIPPEIEILKNRIIDQGKQLHRPIHFTYYDNHGRSHQKGNTECGMYSLFFILTMLTSKTEFKKRMSMQDKLNLFQKKNIPDKYVEKYRKKYYNNPES